MNNDKITAKLHKLLALARAGVGGEKDNAERMLNAMLAKAGMTIADLDDSLQVPTTREFDAKTKEERQLFAQIANCVRPGSKVFTYRGTRGKIYADLTPADFVEVEVSYLIHRPSLKKHLVKSRQTAFTAYIYKNALMPPENPEQEAKPSTLSIEDQLAILTMMQNMDRTHVHKQIGAR
jgi:hypothetical protein